MANWCNARLIVSGRRRAVLEFSRRARSKPSSFFRGDMLVGEDGGLSADRIENLEKGLAQKVYRFQVRNDDGCDHFRSLSKSYDHLRFVLVFGDPSSGTFGSYFIRKGYSREYLIPEEIKQTVMTKHGVDHDSDDDLPYWEASWELMDLAQAHWQRLIGNMSEPRKSKS
ncbi:MAG: hypothetical protein ACREX3_24480, partial [Gammaproteobacteria bacterium]